MAEFLRSHRKVEWLREVITHVMGYGAVVGGVLGATKDSPELIAMSLLWFIVTILIGYRLSCLLDRIDETHKKQ